MESVKPEEIDPSLHKDALGKFDIQWLIIAGIHMSLNGILPLLCLRCMDEPWLTAWSAVVFTSLALVGFSALSLLRAARIEIFDGPVFGAFFRQILAGASITYAFAWSGSAWNVFSNNIDTEIMAVTLLAVLLCVVTVRFSSALGSLARFVVVVQMSSVVVLWLTHDHPWALFYAAGLLLLLLIMFGISLHGSQEYISSYRLRRRQIRLQKELGVRNKHLQLENSSKSRLLATASHDLRQPVHALGLLLGLLRQDPSANEVRAKVEIINAVVESLAKKLEKLMALARLDAGTTQVDIEIMSLNNVLLSLESEFMQAAVEKGLTLKCIGSGVLNVRSDPTLLRIILANLLANAIRYTSQGGVSVVATAINNMVRLEVRDTGVGIPADRIPDIFEAFVRLNNAVSDSEGLGLGLAISRRVAELLGIQIVAHSIVGIGTTFTIDIPSALDQPLSQVSTCSQESLHGLRILVVDDDLVVLPSMVQTLESWGCQVVNATGLSEMESKLSFIDNPFDLVITDYHLGFGYTGMDIIRRVRRKYKLVIPAILLTGDVEIRVDSELEAANLHIVHKPISPARLSGAIVRVRTPFHKPDSNLTTPATLISQMSRFRF